MKRGSFFNVSSAATNLLLPLNKPGTSLYTISWRVLSALKNTRTFMGLFAFGEFYKIPDIMHNNWPDAEWWACFVNLNVTSRAELICLKEGNNASFTNCRQERAHSDQECEKILTKYLYMLYFVTLHWFSKTLSIFKSLWAKLWGMFILCWV